MPRIPKLLAGPILITNSAVTIYTVPAATIALVRNIHIQNNSASPVVITSVSFGAAAAGTRIFDGQTIAANGTLDLWGYWPLVATTVISVQAGTTNVLNITIGGDEITLG